MAADYYQTGPSGTHYEGLSGMNPFASATSGGVAIPGNELGDRTDPNNLCFSYEGIGEYPMPCPPAEAVTIAQQEGADDVERLETAGTLTDPAAILGEAQSAADTWIPDHPELDALFQAAYLDALFSALDQRGQGGAELSEAVLASLEGNKGTHDIAAQLALFLMAHEQTPEPALV